MNLAIRCAVCSHSVCYIAYAMCIGYTTALMMACLQHVTETKALTRPLEHEMCAPQFSSNQNSCMSFHSPVGRHRRGPHDENEQLEIEPRQGPGDFGKIEGLSWSVSREDCLRDIQSSLRQLAQSIQDRTFRGRTRAPDPASCRARDS